jgi:hypothetical protein
VISKSILERIESPDHVDRLGAALELRRLSFDEDEMLAQAAAELLEQWCIIEEDPRVSPYLQEFSNMIANGQENKAEWQSKHDADLRNSVQKYKELQNEMAEMKKKYDKLLSQLLDRR